MENVAKQDDFKACRRCDDCGIRTEVKSDNEEVCVLQCSICSREYPFYKSPKEDRIMRKITENVHARPEYETVIVGGGPAGLSAGIYAMRAAIKTVLVEKGAPGFRPGKKENKLGLRASDTAEMIFEDCKIPKQNCLGTPGEAFVDCLKILDYGRIGVGAIAVGIAQGAFEASLAYAKERKQFGKPIGAFQAIRWKLADMATEIDAARLLTLRAATLVERGRPFKREASMAKLYAAEAAFRAASEAVQIHGGYGFIKDYPVEKYFRDVKLCAIGEGTSEIQRMVIARELLGPM